MYSFARSLIDPLTISFALIGFSLLWSWWKHPDARKGLKTIVLAFLLAWIASTKVAAYFAAGLLEWHYPPVLEMPADAEAIVLLSGGASPPTDFLPETRPTCDTLRRCRAAAQLYHTEPCPIIACGGSVNTNPETDKLAHVLQEELVRMGVDENDILLEESSLDTYHNAVEAKRILDEQGWSRVVMVTDGTHLVRAQMCFTKRGADVIPAAAHYATLRAPYRVADFLPSTDGVNIASAALHELVGIVWYKIRGRI